MEKHYSRTETANLIRKALKESFPDTKFSVTSKSYSGGSSINVSYTDGPLSKDVKAIVDLFEGAGFDGMTDYKYFHKARTFRGELTSFNYGFVFVERNVSPSLLVAAAKRVANETGLPQLTLTDNHYFSDGEYQVEFTYFPENDVIAHGKSQRIAGGEWYSQFVYQVANNTTTPHKVGKTELPQIIDKRLEDLKITETVAVN